MSEPSSPRIDGDLVEHPGIVFRDGPAGRRAALALGPDVWEVVRSLRELDERGDAAVSAAAELLHLAPTQVRTAIRYHVACTQEIDAEVTEADTASAEAEAAWRVEQRTPG